MKGWSAALVVLVLLGAPLQARAEQVGAESGSGHRLSLLLRTGGAAYLSPSRTVVGAGGGVGLRDTVNERFLLQADVGYLMGAGGVASLRLGAGVQRQGLWTPALLVSVQGLWGNQFSFLTAEHPEPVRFPAFSVGASVAPLRFSQQGVQISLLELGVGVGSDLPGLGVSYSVGLLEIGFPL